MNRQYYNLYRTKTLNHAHLKQKILQLYSQDPHNLPMNLDQILYYLDLKCEGRKADRDISVELFNQTANNIHKATLEALVTKYIQNLQTSQLCLKRDQMRLTQLLNQREKAEIRKKSFIFLKIIQVSIYSKFTKQSVIQYKIMPTNIPSVTLANAINPVLNHQFILQMEQPSFDLIFEESGIEIYRWTFPDQPYLQEGQYEKLITTQNIAFQVRIRYLPQGNTKGRENLSEQIQKLNIQIDRQREVFKKLCNYESFLGKKVLQNSQEQDEQQGDFHFFLKCFPFLKNHIGFSFWLTTILTILQCWAASIWPMQFLDIILCIYLIGILLDVQVKDYSMKLLVLQLSIALLSLKSIWGLVTQPFFNKSQTNKYSIILCISLKIVLILGLSIVRGRQYEIQRQKMQFIFGQQLKEQKKEVLHKLQLNIWDEL